MRGEVPVQLPVAEYGEAQNRHGPALFVRLPVPIDAAARGPATRYCCDEGGVGTDIFIIS